MNGLMCNMKVQTPLGIGLYQAMFAVQDGAREPVTTGALVRLPINKETEKARKNSNCLTPKAQVSGLWVFPVEVIEPVDVTKRRVAVES